MAAVVLSQAGSRPAESEEGQILHTAAVGPIRNGVRQPSPFLLSIYLDDDAEGCYLHAPAFSCTRFLTIPTPSFLAASRRFWFVEIKFDNTGRPLGLFLRLRALPQTRGQLSGRTGGN